MTTYPPDRSSGPAGEYVHLEFRRTDGEPLKKFEGYGLTAPRSGDSISLSSITIHDNVAEDPNLPIDELGEFEVTQVHRNYLTLIDESSGEPEPRDKPIVYVTVTLDERERSTDGGDAT